MKKRMNFQRQVWIWFVLIAVNGSKFCIVLDLINVINLFHVSVLVSSFDIAVEDQFYV